MALCLALFPLPTRALDIRIDDAIVIGPEERIDDDVLAIGGSVAVFGDVRGDVLAIGERVLVGGTIAGDLLAAGPSVETGATLGGSLRTLAGEMVLGGAIARNALALAGSVRQPEGSSVAGRLIALAGELDLRGTVRGGGAIAAGAIHLDADLGGPLQIDVGQITLGEAAVVPSLVGTSRHAVGIPSNARVDATAVTIRGPDWRDDLLALARAILRAATIASAFTLVLGATAVGWRWPEVAPTCRATIAVRPGSVLVVGLFSLLLSAGLGGLLLLTLVGAMPGMLLLALALLIATVGWGVAALMIGDLLGRDGAGTPLLPAPLRAFGGGLCLLLVAAVPFLGGALALLTVVAGAGSVLLGLIARTGRVHSPP